MIRKHSRWWVISIAASSVLIAAAGVTFIALGRSGYGAVLLLCAVWAALAAVFASLNEALIDVNGAVCKTNGELLDQNDRLLRRLREVLERDDPHQREEVEP